MHWWTEGRLVHWSEEVVARAAAYVRSLPPVYSTITEIIGGLLVLVIAWWIWWRLPKRQVARLTGLTDPKDRGDLENNFRQTITQTVGGLAVLSGAVFAYVQFMDQRNDFVHQQQSADRKFKEQQNEFLRQQQSAHDLLVSNQVSKGFEDLGSAQLMVQIGGIYALEGVMNGSPQYHQAVLEGLAAFVRANTKEKANTATNVQAALTVIGRRAAGAGRLDLDNANLSDADLAGADLTGANLFNANLTFAHLAGANLTGAVLFAADLTGANLTGADLDSTNLAAANLFVAHLAGANLTGADLDGANLAGATINQRQLDNACGTDVTLPSHTPHLTIKPCPQPSGPGAK
jgi:uncharacterized protein YjbI with pentapeptide repeats